MKLKIYISLLLLFIICPFYAQVGIGTTSPSASSMLEISSTNSGLLIPRVALTSTSDILTIVSPVTSLLVYNSGFSPNGYYYWNGTVWVQMAASNTAWTLTGNTGTAVATNFFGTTDDVDIVFKRNNIGAGYIGNPTIASTGPTKYNNSNTAFGANSLLNTTGNVAAQTGIRNVAVGSNVLPGNTTGSSNTALGDRAMNKNTSGAFNSVVGTGALFSNTSGYYNSALGRNALVSNLTGDGTTALGYNSGYSSIGNFNIFLGHNAGYNETGSNKLYIEIAPLPADSSQNNALIYGDYGSTPKIVRANAQLQVGNPATTGYAFPNNQGTNGQILQTDGIGATAWVSTTALTISETDPQVSSSTTNFVPKWNGTTLVDGVIIDDGTNVGVGIAPSAGNKLDVNGKTKTADFQMTTGANTNYILQSDASGNASWALPNSKLSIVRSIRNGASDQSLTNAGWQKVLFDAIVFDTNTEFNTGANQFVATKSGYYQVNAGFHIKSNTSTNQFSIGVRINNGFYQEEGSNHSGSGILSRDINCIVNLVAGDYVEIFVENTYTGATIDGYSGKTYFEVKQIR